LANFSVTERLALSIDSTTAELAACIATPFPGAVAMAPALSGAF
jgi:hypothetical protein